MAVKQLKLQTLADFNGGKVAAAFDHHVKRVIEDCDDRPGETKARKITLEVEVVPRILQDGAATDCEITAKVKSTVPAHIAAPVVCQIRRGGIAAFNDLSEDNPHQRTLDEIGEE